VSLPRVGRQLISRAVGRMKTMTDRELRVAVGEKLGRRSTVWKFFVHKNDTYIMTRMFGREAKVSIHESRASQWSATSDWVRGEPWRKNADRHITKWISAAPMLNTAAPVFRVLISESELRTVRGTENTKGVCWVPPLPSGATFAFDCFVTPPTPVAPIPNQASYLHIKSLPLVDGRWFVILLTQVMIAAEGLEQARREVLQNAREAGLEFGTEHRAALFFQGAGMTPGLIELALPE
jgi:hypothetical protein